MFTPFSHNLTFKSSLHLISTTLGYHKELIFIQSYQDIHHHMVELHFHHLLYRTESQHPPLLSQPPLFLSVGPNRRGHRSRRHSLTTGPREPIYSPRDTLLVLRMVVSAQGCAKKVYAKFCEGSSFMADVLCIGCPG